MRYTLDGTWNVSCFEPGSTTPTFAINATVPGNIELDLHAAGIEPEPYFGENEYLYHKYEVCSWEYSRTFTMPDYSNPFLDFEGINCISDIYIDEKLIGHTENSYIAHRFAIPTVERGKAHTLRIVIHSAVMHARSFDYPVHISANEGSDEFTRLRMPPHSFGWDIMPRFPSAGLWRSVFIEDVPTAHFTQVYYGTLNANESKAELMCRFRFSTPDALLDGYKIRIYLDDTLYAEKPMRFISGECAFSVPSPRLWWPLGYGSPELYTARTELVKGDEILDIRVERIGIRIAEVVHKMQANDDGEFLVKVNGCPILIKGSNWVPMDAFHSRDAARYEKAVSLFVECGCNMMRMWGGNVYEDHKLFDLCDENGILVWQDFSMGCALYPQDSDFMRRIEEEAVSVVRKLRNHPCILLWAGDNEVDEAYSGKHYANSANCYNAITREVLPRVIRENDPYRMFMPSSPYIDNGIARYDVPEQHNWGPRAYFKDDFYKLTRAHFVSECGYHGCPSVESLKRFIPENELNDMTSGSWAAHNAEYRIAYKRGYDRNQLMRDQVQIMFGEVPSDLEEFSLLSQFTQAEAKKFFVERTRLKKWRRTGIIWWNMLDGWPQISDAVVDWYYTKKRAFETIRRVQVPICVIVDEVSGWYNDVYVCNDSRESALVSYRMYDADTNETLLEGSVTSKANENVQIGTIRGFASQQRLILIEWTINGKRYVNHYLCGYPAYKVRDVHRWIKLIDEV